MASASFELDAVSEDGLSSWMEQRLPLVTWSKPEGANLDEIETAVVRGLHPPLNLDEVGEPRNRLREARKPGSAWRMPREPGNRVSAAMKSRPVTRRKGVAKSRRRDAVGRCKPSAVVVRSHKITVLWVA